LQGRGDIVIEIEGHADQVGNPEYNEELSKQRAQFIANQFSHVSSSQVRTHHYGERKPINPTTDSNSHRGNEQLAINRRVEVRIYLRELALQLPPSRTGFKAMEQCRLGQISAGLDENEKLRALSLSILQSVLGITSYIPGVAIASRFSLIAYQSSGVLINASQFLDDVLFDHYLNALAEHNKNANRLASLEREAKEIIHKLQLYGKADSLDRVFQTPDELLSHLKTNQYVGNELIKRYHLRALAINGLMMLIHRVCKDGEAEFEQHWQHYQVDRYISTYIEQDNWSYRSASYQTLADIWIMRIHHSAFYEYNKKTEEQRGLPSISPSFNLAFPVQDKVYTRENSVNLKKFARQFNTKERQLESDDIGLMQLLISDPHSEQWQHYADWAAQSKGNQERQLSPFHRLKWQIILNNDSQDMDTNVFNATLSYSRTDDTFFNTSGPNFTVMFKPMLASEFSVDLDDTIQDYYDHGDHNSTPNDNNNLYLTACEFEPFYYFGDALISGVKPIVSEHSITLSESMKQSLRSEREESIARSRSYGVENAIHSVGEIEEEMLRQYVSRGHLQHMTYEFSLSGKLFDLPLSLHPRRSEALSLPMSLNSHDRISVPALSGFGGASLTIRSKDLLLPHFLSSAEVKKGASRPLFESVESMRCYLQHGSDYLALSSGHPMNEVMLQDKHPWNWEQPNTNTLHVFIFTQTLNDDTYQKMKLNWKKTPISLSFAMDDYGGKPSDIGPSYKGNLHYLLNIQPNQTRSLKERISDNHDFFNRIEGPLKHKLDDFVQQHDKKSGYVFMASIDLAFIAPNGGEYDGLRPFSHHVNRDDGYCLSVIDLKQTNCAHAKTLIPHTKPYQVNLVGRCEPEKLPYFNAVTGKQVKDKDLASRWEELDKQKRIERLKIWIEDSNMAKQITPTWL
ncbi:OmpA family protein, partial [Vibrio sp.]|nr:OmpA family protein [Vibrio sp.]